LYLIYSKNNPADLAHSYKENKKAFLKKKDFKLIEEGDGQINGESCKWMLFTFATEDGSIIKGKQYTLKKSGRGFILQYLLQESKFESSKVAFEKIIASLKLI
jgi:hypothetical protein